MSLHRFFLDGPLPGFEPEPIALTLEDLHHARHVLRIKEGDRVALVGSDGKAGVVKITEMAGEAQGRLEALELRASEPRVTLFQGLAKGHRMSLVVQKATELGVEAIVPVAFERSVVRLEAQKGLERAERWSRVALEAAKQSQRSSVPRVSAPVAGTELTAMLAGFDAVVVPWEEAEGAPGIAEALRPVSDRSDARVAAVIGPEGGLTEREVAELGRAGAVTVTLGDNVLRTETAAIAALTLVLHEMGGLGGR